MPKSAERNDVDISQLFKWTKEVEVTDPSTDQKFTFYLRLVGDNELGRARAYGLRKAGELRRKLRDETSDDYIAFVSDIQDFPDKETLVQAVIMLVGNEVQTEAIRNTDLREPKVPKSDAEQEVLEVFQKELDEYEVKYWKLVEKEIERLVKKYNKTFMEKSMEELHETYRSLVANRLCTAEMTSSFYNMCVYFATYRDAAFKARLFKQFDDFDNTAPSLKTRLIDEYKRLEVGMEVLKKLPEATE